MTFDFDTSKLSQAAARKITLHDNCIVLDLGTGSFPRDIEVRLPDDDGARQIAIWDGGLDLAINDEVLCNEYAGNPKWRIAGMGGADNGAGKQRVSKIWESDFGAVAMETDANGDIGVGVVPTSVAKIQIRDASDPQLRLEFNATKFADLQVDTNHDLLIKTSSNGQIKLQPTTDSVNFFQVFDANGGLPVLNVNALDETVSIATANSSFVIETSTAKSKLFIEVPDLSSQRGAVFSTASDTAVRTAINAFLKARVGPAAVQNGDRVGTFNFASYDGTDYNLGAQFLAVIDGVVSTDTVPTSFIIKTSPTNGVGNTDRLRITSNGLIGIGNVTNPSGQVHVDQVSTIAALPVIVLDQADLSEEFINFISTIGAGNPIDTAAVGTFYGKIRVAVNGTFKYIALYNS